MMANNRYNKKSINSKGRKGEGGKPCQARASLNPYLKLFGVFILSFVFLILLSSIAYAFAGYNFFVYNPASIERQALEEIPSPNIKSVSAYPDKVMPGQVLLVTAEVEDVYGIKKAVAFFENEDQPVEMNMLLISGTKYKGIYEARWIAQNTRAQAWYNTTILFTNIFNKKSEAIVTWQDPTVSHTAADITPGTFGAGNYVFPNNLNISGNIKIGGNLQKDSLGIIIRDNNTNVAKFISATLGDEESINLSTEGIFLITAPGNSSIVADCIANLACKLLSNSSGDWVIASDQTTTTDGKYNIFPVKQNPWPIGIKNRIGGSTNIRIVHIGSVS